MARSRNIKASVFIGEEFSIKLSKLDTDFERIAKKAIYAGVEIIADAMKVNLEGILSDQATGQLVASMGTTPIKNMNGEWNAKVGFDGYDSEGVAFQLIARVLESGTSTRQKKPFIRKTLNQTKSQVEAVMAKIVEDELDKIMK